MTGLKSSSVTSDVDHDVYCEKENQIEQSAVRLMSTYKDL
jgi:hypothetical protein